ncbi:MAG: phenylacetate-CoA oxygenase subunit PaaI [Saprospirales bacterium]|nr:MAG: phenylacetate-CoA oxygenase subunit PaaI [Saprospirales bacterium]
MLSYTTYDPLTEYVLRCADNNLILGHRISEWCGHGPVLEQDIALTNMALDLLGQSRMYLKYAAELIGHNETEDSLAFLRDAMQFRNSLLVEQPNGDFAHTIIRSLIFDSFHYFFTEQLMQSNDKRLADIATKSLKEITYHRKFSSEWTIRLGDGTEESNKRMQTAIDDLWRYKGELLSPDELDMEMLEKGIGVDLNKIEPLVDNHLSDMLNRATLQIPQAEFMQKGGKQGLHSEHLGYILAELQFMQRAYPGLNW